MMYENVFHLTKQTLTKMLLFLNTSERRPNKCEPWRLSRFVLAYSKDTSSGPFY